MPRYHFHVFDGEDVRDTAGTELPDLAAAKREAVRYSGALMVEGGGNFWDGRAWRMIVTDHTGVSLFVLVFVGMDTAPLAPEFIPHSSND